MAGNKDVSGARASIIDRLIDMSPKVKVEVHPLKTLTRKQLRASVMRDVSWLMNTRTPLGGEDYDERELTVVDYGIPDFGSYSPENYKHKKLMAKRIARAIEIFEPRLQNVRVEFEKSMPDEKTLRYSIDADLVVDAVREPFSFLTILQLKSGVWEVHEYE